MFSGLDTMPADQEIGANLVLALRSLLEGRLDLIVRGTLLEADHEIDDGNIGCGNTESKTTLHRS